MDESINFCEKAIMIKKNLKYIVYLSRVLTIEEVTDELRELAWSDKSFFLSSSATTEYKDMVGLTNALEKESTF